MSNVKISALPAATTPLTGTELVPLVQSGVTSQVAVSNIKTAPAGSNTQVQFNNAGAFGASASLTWDGTSLTATKFSGALNGTVGATTPSTGAFTTLSATGTLSGGTSGTGYSFNGSAPATSLTLDSAGNLGVGGTPVNSRKLLVSTASQTDISINAGSSAYGQLLFGYTGADNKGIVAYNNSDNSMQFYTNVTERMRLNSTGALVLAGGTTSANGIGIAFPATQSASTDANTLDDYEEGTWTPTVTAVTTTGSPAYAGSYVKIGKQVTATMYSTGNNSPTATYAVAVNSSRFTLPFTTANLNINFQPWTGTSGNGSTTAGGLVAADSATCYFITAITVTNNICATITYSI